MIRQNDFNTAWWGRAVGVLTDRAFFDLPLGEQSAELAPFDWVEFRSPLPAAPSAALMMASGFAMVDTQIGFRINLERVPALSDAQALELRFADESPFVVRADELRPFRHERYSQLPSMTPEKLSDRYARWANLLIEQSPHSCVQVFHQNRLQGWFLAQDAPPGLNLALAMLHCTATISGMLLYQGAMQIYARRGARVGWASFSAGNVQVANMYARVGAQFTDATGYWLWK